MTSPINPSRDRATELAEQRTELAVKRSVIAAERTLLAWIRTSISMIGFGFTIFKFFQYFPTDMERRGILHPNAPRNLGLTLIVLGTIALITAVVQHRLFLQQIGASRPRHLWSLSFIVAIAVVLIGVLAFLGVWLRHGPY